MNTRAEEDLGADAFVPWREVLTGAHAPSLALVCLAVWLHAADSMIVATMIPSIVAEIGGTAFVGWSVSLYEVGSIVAGAAGAVLTMRHGLRAPMAIAAVVFGTGCALAALAPTMPVLLVGRALQGLGGGGLVAMSFVAIGVLFPRRLAARALAAVSTLWGVSAFLGPLVGGAFVELGSWRAGFWFFAVQALALAAWIATRPDPAARADGGGAPAAGRLPLGRLGLLCVAVVLVAAAGVRIEPVRTFVLVAGGVVCLALFLAWDARANANRLLPRRPLDPRRPTGAALLMILALSMATIAITAYGPLLVTSIHGASALTAGYIVACSSIGWTVMAVLVSGLPERFDRLLIACGMVVVTLSIVGFLVVVPRGPVWLIAACAALEGGGFGMAWTFVLRRTTALAEPDESRRVAGSIPTIQRLGYALGSAYVGVVANASGLLTMQSAGAAADVAHAVFLACLPAAAVGLLAMVRLVRF